MDPETIRQLSTIPEVRNRCNVFARENGILLKEMGEGAALVELEVSERTMNPWGSVHGGCLYTMADVAAGAAASTVMSCPTTVNSSFSFLRPGLNTKRLTAQGKVIKCGRRIAVVSAEIFDDAGRLLCTGTFTYMPIERLLEDPAKARTEDMQKADRT